MGNLDLVYGINTEDVGKMTTDYKEKILLEFERSDEDWENNNKLKKIYTDVMDSYVDDLYGF